MVRHHAAVARLESTIVGLRRGCSKTGCARPAVATLTYAYADRAVVLGPLATYAEPHTYDLCLVHAERMTAPRGWDVVRVGEFSEPALATDDLLALADAVREQGHGQGQGKGHGPRTSRPGGSSGRSVGADGPRAPAATEAAAEAGSGAVEAGRRGHLRILRDS
ncbi:MAG: DUF3499 domain-containing protein [Terracoccus sp.]